MARYATTLFAERLARAGIEWPAAVTGDEHRVRATLTRGDLVLRSDQIWPGWWLPQKKGRAKEIVDRLAPLIERLHKQFADADETGRRRIVAYRNPAGALNWQGVLDYTEPVTVVLGPGVHVGTGSGSLRPLAWSLMGQVPGAALSPEEAIESGWMRVEEDVQQV